MFEAFAFIIALILLGLALKAWANSKTKRRQMALLPLLALTAALVMWSLWGIFLVCQLYYKQVQERRAIADSERISIPADNVEIFDPTLEYSKGKPWICVRIRNRSTNVVLNYIEFAWTVPDGDQSVTVDIHRRTDGVAPGEVYVVTHPASEVGFEKRPDAGKLASQFRLVSAKGAPVKESK